MKQAMALSLLGVMVLSACAHLAASQSKPMQAVSLEPGETYRLNASIVHHEIQGKEVRMYAYNGQLPGPLLKVKQNSTVQQAPCFGCMPDAATHICDEQEYRDFVQMRLHP
ncbi:hypothetical protein HY642_02630 [Candidatus Woesearchaeota archaeon]|nr:hypothetical protein [Candidatus Woesearchaeota archaeon]